MIVSKLDMFEALLLLLISIYLSDILVSNLAALLDIRRALGDILNGVAAKNKLIFLGLGNFDSDARTHGHSADNLLANEVPENVKN